MSEFYFFVNCISTKLEGKFKENDNKNITPKFLEAKAAHRREFKALKAYIIKEESFKINNANFYLKILEKQ